MRHEVSTRRRLAGLVAALALGLSAMGLAAAAAGLWPAGSPHQVLGHAAATRLPTAAPVASRPATSPAGAWSGVVLVADRGNGRVIAVDRAGAILWQFPGPGRPSGLPEGHAFAADDAFFAPDGKTIVANDEDGQMIYRIDIATDRVVWSYGTYGVPGSRRGFLHTPDDAYPLANGDVLVADIFNCRILLIGPSRTVVRQWGRTGDCRAAPPASLGEPNGDTPLPDGGMLITEIVGSRVVRLDAAGRVVFDIHVPVAYPSDAHLDAHGNVLVADYSSPGAIVLVSPAGRLLWRYAPQRGPGELDHPSLAVPLADGTIMLNDDDRARVLLLDPKNGRILWQYGVTDEPSVVPGFLSVPDGLDPAPPGIRW